MPDFIEAVVTLLPSDAGGRLSAIAPRDGSYRPFARSADARDLLRIRVIEGPPQLRPGDAARVVAEVENLGSADPALEPGCELDLLERDERLVGMISILRFWRIAG
jgi:hypothetical protein